MAKGVNKVILIGRLGRDPEVRYTPGGAAVANVYIATSEIWKDKQSGENQERTEWHRVVFFARLAEIVGEYLKKGSQVYIEGRLQTRKWQDKDNQDRYTTEIVANEMQMLDSKSGGNFQGMDQMDPMDDASGQGQQRTSPQSRAPKQPSAPVGGDLDDDIPF